MPGVAIPVGENERLAKNLKISKDLWDEMFIECFVKLQNITGDIEKHVHMRGMPQKEAYLKKP